MDALCFSGWLISKVLTLEQILMRLGASWMGSKILLSPFWKLRDIAGMLPLDFVICRHSTKRHQQLFITPANGYLRNSLTGYYTILLLVKDAHDARGHEWPNSFMAKPTVVNILWLEMNRVRVDVVWLSRSAFRVKHGINNLAVACDVVFCWPPNRFHKCVN